MPGRRTQRRIVEAARLGVRVIEAGKPKKDSAK
jgi:hypothetical protein